MMNFFLTFRRDEIELVRAPSTQQDRNKYTTVLNDNKVIVGNIVADGVYIDFLQSVDNTTDLTLCFRDDLLRNVTVYLTKKILIFRKILV